MGVASQGVILKMQINDVVFGVIFFTVLISCFVFSILYILHKCRRCGAWFTMQYISSSGPPDMVKRYRCKKCGDVQIRNDVQNLSI